MDSRFGAVTFRVGPEVLENALARLEEEERVLWYRGYPRLLLESGQRS
jgi:hypothetical protein